MIDIKELRLGNYVSTNGIPMYSHKGGAYKVVGINGDLESNVGGLNYISSDDKTYKVIEVFGEQLEPILLTPEILEKCGFKYIEDQRVYRLSIDESDGVEINYSIKKGKIDFEEDSAIWFISCDPYEGHEFEWVPRSLHELQNAYYFITHEELEVNI